MSTDSTKQSMIIISAVVGNNQSVDESVSNNQVTDSVRYELIVILYN